MTTRSRLGLGLLGLLILPVAVGVLVVMTEPPPSESAASASPSGPPPVVPPADPAMAGGPVERSDRLSRSDPVRARALLRDVLRSDRDNVAALERLGEKRLNDEAHEEAQALALRCLEADPDNERCKAVLDHALGPPNEDREQSLELCLARNESDTACLTGRLTEYIKNGNYEGAEELIPRLRAADPAGAMTRLAAGRLHAARGDYAAALAEFEAVCRAGHDHGCYRARTLRAEGW